MRVEDDQRLTRVTLWRCPDPECDHLENRRIEHRHSTQEPPWSVKMQLQPRTFLDAESLAEELDRRAESRTAALHDPDLSESGYAFLSGERAALREAARLVREGGDD